KAMGLQVAAIDVADDKLRLATSLGAEMVVHASSEGPARTLKKALGGAPTPPSARRRHIMLSIQRTRHFARAEPAASSVSPDAMATGCPSPSAGSSTANYRCAAPTSALDSIWRRPSASPWRAA